jgi:hypothetical protein
MGEAGTVDRPAGVLSRRAEEHHAARRRTLAPDELAWIVALPGALAGLLAILVLGPALGHLLFRPVPAADALWPPGWFESSGKPEPVELGRYLIAAAAPVLAAGLVVALARRPRTVPAALVRPLVLASQGLLVAFVALAFLGQRGVVLTHRALPHVFGIGTLLAAAALVPAGLLALRRPGVARRIARLARETPLRRSACLALAATAAVLWLLEGVLVDGLVEDQNVLAWTVDDAFAILDGRTPLVDYHLLYAKLLPYPAALTMAVLGKTTLVYSLLMLVLSVLALLGVYGIFRRILRSSPLALALFVPFVALSAVEHTMSLTAMWPMRYGGAYLMAWLSARAIERDGRRVWPLFAIGAVVAVNETEFGAAAVLAALAAIACVRAPRTWRAALRLLGEAAAGLLAGLALIALLTLVRSGSLPDPALLDEWPRIFTRLGWFSLGMPPASLHLALYATFAATLLVVAVRLVRRERDVLLTGMLAWSGVFGLAAASYYAGRSDEIKLVSMFSAWAFALALLTIATARALAAQGWRRPSPAQLLALFGCALAVCSIADFPLPQHQISRLVDEPPGNFRARAERFVGGLAQPHERVAILLPMGHRIAYDLGLENVFPYPTQDALVTRWQLDTTLDAIRRAHVHRIFLHERMTAPQQLAVLRRAGFRPSAQQEELVALEDGVRN